MRGDRGFESTFLRGESATGRSTRARSCSGSKCSMMIAVPQTRIVIARLRSGRKMPFGPAGRSRRIKGTEGLVTDRRVGKSLRRRVEIGNLCVIARAVDDETAFDARALRHRLQRDATLGGRGDHDLR